MNTQESIIARRSVKHYDPKHVMPEEDLNKLMELALLSPTSFNMQNWRFVVVQEPSLRKEIQAASWNQAQVSEASVLILLCADLESHNQKPERYWADAPEEAANMLVPMIPKFYNGQDQLQRDEAMRSVGIAGQTLMLTAKSMGYDSCPMIGFDPVKVAELIKLPENHLIGMMLTIGKASKPAWARGGQLPMDDVVFKNHFPS
jgi:nitroreductase